MKRILAFTLAILLLLGISGIGYYHMDRKRRAEEKRVEEMNQSYDELLQLINEEKYAEAITQAEDCLSRLDPEENGEMVADVLLKLACVEALEGDKEGAMSHCDEALTLQPNYAEALLLSSGLYSDMGEAEKSEETLRRYMALSGDYSYSYRLGLTAIQAEDFEAAIADLSDYIDKSLCVSDSEAADDALYFRGIAHLALEEYPEAAEDFERCIKGRVEYEDSLFNAALCRLLNEENVRALALFNRCVAENINAEKAAEYIALTNELLKEEADSEEIEG